VVTLADSFAGGLARKDALPHICAQVMGGIAGTVSAHLMFGLPAISLSQHTRSGAAQLYSEAIAAFGPLGVIAACSKLRPSAIPLAVGSYIAAAYWFTSSTSFANPAVTVARCITDTLAGIRPRNVPGFLFAQAIDALLAVVVFRWLLRETLNAENGASQ